MAFRLITIVLNLVFRAIIIMASGTMKERIKTYSLGNVTLNAGAYFDGGELPSAYQGAKAYSISAGLNGAYLGGGVNSSSDYHIFLFNNYTVQLTFTNVYVTCFF